MRRKVEQEGYLQLANKSGAASMAGATGYGKANHILGFSHHSPNHVHLPPLSPLSLSPIPILPLSSPASASVSLTLALPLSVSHYV